MTRRELEELVQEAYDMGYKKAMESIEVEDDLEDDPAFESFYNGYVIALEEMGYDTVAMELYIKGEAKKKFKKFVGGAALTAGLLAAAGNAGQKAEDVSKAYRTATNRQTINQEVDYSADLNKRPIRIKDTDYEFTDKDDERMYNEKVGQMMKSSAKKYVESKKLGGGSNKVKNATNKEYEDAYKDSRKILDDAKSSGKYKAKLAPTIR